MNNLKFLHQKSYDNFHSPYSGGFKINDTNIEKQKSW